MPQLNHLALMCEYKSRKLNSVPVVEDGAKRVGWLVVLGFTAL